jgi:hypothetical protein
MDNIFEYAGWIGLGHNLVPYKNAWCIFSRNDHYLWLDFHRLFVELIRVLRITFLLSNKVF